MRRTTSAKARPWLLATQISWYVEFVTTRTRFSLISISVHVHVAILFTHIHTHTHTHTYTHTHTCSWCIMYSLNFQPFVAELVFYLSHTHTHTHTHTQIHVFHDTRCTPHSYHIIIRGACFLYFTCSYFPLSWCTSACQILYPCKDDVLFYNAIHYCVS